MKLSKLLEQTKHTEFDVSGHLSKIISAQEAKYKNIKNLTYGPGTTVETICLEGCTYEESQKRMAELDRRISEAIMKFNIELQTTGSVTK